MVELKGTEKQIAWAERIRAEKIAEMDAKMAPRTEKDAAAKAFIMDVLKNEFNSAADWIEHRNDPLMFIMRWVRTSPKFAEFAAKNA